MQEEVGGENKAAALCLVKREGGRRKGSGAVGGKKTKPSTRRIGWSWERATFRKGGGA